MLDCDLRPGEAGPVPETLERSNAGNSCVLNTGCDARLLDLDGLLKMAD